MINVIIPAAGIGTRLRPHTHTLPKALLPVAGRPILGHILNRIKGLDDLGPIWMVVGFKAPEIKAYVQSRFDLDVRFVQQNELRGLGHAIYLSMAEIPNDNPILVILGDTILEVDLAAFMSGTDDVLGVREVADPRRFGVVELDADGHRIKRLVEKPADPPSNLAVVGLYGIHNTQLFRGALADVVASNTTSAGEIQVTDALQLMVERGSRMRAHRVEGWYDCGNFETILETNRYLLETTHTPGDPKDSVVVAPSFVSPRARVVRSVIGPYASIGDDAEVVDSVVRNAIVSEGARVCRCVLEDSIIGTGAVVEGTAARLNVGESSEIGMP
ncbi:MAG TPA: sugar phosphate nucleotidyltransferase [Acidobacteriota bacterium]|nr:sugar phosphate nucleotidyltransferase [Acidobacteriota bacterium]